MHTIPCPLCQTEVELQLDPTYSDKPEEGCYIRYATCCETDISAVFFLDQDPPTLEIEVNLEGQDINALLKKLKEQK